MIKSHRNQLGDLVKSGFHYKSTGKKSVPSPSVTSSLAHASAPLRSLPSLPLSTADLLPLFCVPPGAVATPAQSPVAQGKGPPSQGYHCWTLEVLRAGRPWHASGSDQAGAGCGPVPGRSWERVGEVLLTSEHKRG